MRAILVVAERVSRILEGISGVALTIMMCLTVADVIGRAGGRPILGMYEIISLMAVAVFGFAVPVSSWTRSHVSMEFGVRSFSQKKRMIMNIFTRVLCIFLFGFMAINLVRMASNFRMGGEVTSTLKLPFFPAAYGLAVCCLIECVVLILDIVKMGGGKYE
jgi:TRAP-type C4-dicarboxylate transport system permease small subunit